MTQMKELTPPPFRPESRVWYGYFADDVTDFANMAFVILPDFDEDQRWGPCRWQSRDNATFPAKGDDCIVVFDNHMNVWVVSWWSGEEPVPGGGASVEEW